MQTKIAGLNAIISGEGKPLIMLHGFLSCKELFCAQVEFFSKFFKVVAVDMVGFNGQQMAYPYSLEDYKNDLNRLIDQLKVPKVDVLAHSFGCRVVLKTLLAENKIDKVVFTGPAGLKPKRNLKTQLAILKYKLLKRVLPKQKLAKYGSSDYRDLSPIMKKSFVQVISETFDEKLRFITNQTLIVQGENDAETPLYMAEHFAKRLPNAQLALIKNGNHFAFLHCHGQFNLIVKEFLL